MEKVNQLITKNKKGRKWIAATVKNYSKYCCLGSNTNVIGNPIIAIIYSMIFDKLKMN